MIGLLIRAVGVIFVLLMIYLVQGSLFLLLLSHLFPSWLLLVRYNWFGSVRACLLIRPALKLFMLTCMWCHWHGIVIYKTLVFTLYFWLLEWCLTVNLCGCLLVSTHTNIFDFNIATDVQCPFAVFTSIRWCHYFI